MVPGSGSMEHPGSALEPGFPCPPSAPLHCSSSHPQDIQRFILRSLGEKRQLYYAMEHLGTSFKDPVSHSASVPSHPSALPGGMALWFATEFSTFPP